MRDQIQQHSPTIIFIATKNEKQKDVKNSPENGKHEEELNFKQGKVSFCLFCALSRGKLLSENLFGFLKHKEKGAGHKS